MTRTGPSPSELEADANRLSAGLGVTVDRLRHQLTPAHLLGEWAESSGLKAITPDKVFDLTARRHPVPTALVGAGLGILAYAIARRWNIRNRQLDLTPNRLGNDREPGPRDTATDIVGSLTETATKAFREHAETQRKAVIDAARSHVGSAAKQLSGLMETTLDDILAHIPVSADVRPALVTTVQLLLVAALEAVLPKPAPSSPIS
jgi:hypothetical protein